MVNEERDNIKELDKKLIEIIYYANLKEKQKALILVNILVLLIDEWYKRWRY